MAIREVEPEEAHREATDSDRPAVLLDVRTEMEFDDGHPAGAINIPVGQPGIRGLQMNPDFLRVVTAHIPTDARVIITCRTGQRSMMACQMLEQSGWSDLANLRTGFAGHVGPTGQVVAAGWEQCDLPTDSGAPPDRNYADLLTGATN